jgi:hypothetical protein
MARAFSAKKSKAGKPIKCGRCGEAIKPGEQYFYFSVGFRGAKSIRCKDHRPRQSELCGSKMSGAYAALEGATDSVNEATNVDDIKSAIESCAEEIGQVRDEYQDSYDSLPDNFRDGQQGEDIQEKIDGLQEFEDSLSGVPDDIDGIDPDADDVLQEARDIATNALDAFEL